MQRTIIIGVHKGLDEKKPSLPKFCLGFNGERMAKQYWPFAEKPPRGDLHQKKLNQSLNGLKKKQDFHIWMLLLKQSPVEPLKALPS
ncbi:hypothetical protein ACYZUD_07020 [Pseudomonas sp. XS1P51]